MLIDEMHYRFEEEIDKIATNDRPEFLPNQRDNYLQRAIWIFLKERYNISQSGNAFETNQNRISELANLHIKSPELQPAVTPTSIGNGRYEIRLNTLAHRYLFLTQAKILTRKNNCDRMMDLKLIQVDDKKLLYEEPSFDWYRVYGNFGKSTVATPTTNAQIQSLYIDTTNQYGVSQFTVVSAYLSYLKYPNRVFFAGYNHIDGQSVSAGPQIHCDIDDAFHDEIVTLAANIAFKDIQDTTGYQLSKQKTIEDLN